jgi:hypothetical protein
LGVAPAPCCGPHPMVPPASAVPPVSAERLSATPVKDRDVA